MYLTEFQLYGPRFLKPNFGLHFSGLVVLYRCRIDKTLGTFKAGRILSYLA